MNILLSLRTVNFLLASQYDIRLMLLGVSKAEREHKRWNFSLDHQLDLQVRIQAQPA